MTGVVDHKTLIAHIPQEINECLALALLLMSTIFFFSIGIVEFYAGALRNSNSQSYRLRPT